jgi:hypothetical protein
VKYCTGRPERFGEADVEEDETDFTRNFGPTTRPYLAPYVYNRDFLNKQHGIRKEGEKYKIRDSTVTILYKYNI